MKSSVKRPLPRIAAFCSLVLFFLDIMAFACSESSIPITVRRDFVVRVVNSGQAFSDVPIELSTVPASPNEDSRTIVTASTHHDGTVSFAGIKPGHYFVAIRSVAFPDSKTVWVASHSSSPATSEIIFEWPRVKPLSAQSPSGLVNAQLRTGKPLEDLTHQIFEPLGDAKLTLLQPASGKVIEFHKASESGSFSFHPVPAGLYFLRLEMPTASGVRYYSSDGYIPIRIDPLARSPLLTLSVYQGVCDSLRYKQEEEIMAQ